MRKLDMFLWEYILYVIVAIDMIAMVYMAIFDYQGRILSMVVILANLSYIVWIYSLRVKCDIQHHIE